jgi:ParB family chromosome partitioning protein
VKIEDVPVDKIKIGKRHRADMGDVEGLAANIRDIGLLQPIGIDLTYQLIFGFRRMWACKDILKWKTVPAAILNIESILAGEYAENEFRKQFTASERIAIGEAMEREEFKKHQGKRTDKLVPDSAQVDHEKTRDKIARAVGFGGHETMRQAQQVTKKGAPELIAAMDTGEVSIDAAAKIASQPKAEQKRIVELPRDERREAVKQIRKTRAEREADEKRAYDVRVFRGLYDAVTLIADFTVDAKETWAGLARVYATKFSPNLDRALECLSRLRRAHPNEGSKPGIVARSAK